MIFAPRPSRRCDGSTARAEHERGAARAGRHVPQAHGGDDGAVMLDDQRQAVRGATASRRRSQVFSKRDAPKQMSSIMPRPRVTEGFFSDFEHGRVPPEQGSFDSAHRLDGSRPSGTNFQVSACLGLPRRAGRRRDDVRLQRRRAVERDRGIRGRVGARALDQHLVADLQREGSM